MSNPTNKVKFGLKNVHVAKLTEASDGTYSFGNPKAVPGAVNLSLDAEGDTEPFYADNVVYYRSTSNNGYSGDLEMALVPDWFRETYLREIVDSNGVMIESANISDPVYFAMMFEFDGDKHKTRHVMYKCSVSRPSVASQTRENSNSPVTETLSITCDALADGTVKAKTTADTDTTAYNSWFTSVYTHSLTTDQMNGSAGAAVLATLVVSDATLDPTFAAGTTEYAASTTESSATVTATAGTGVAVAITVNGNSIASGGSVSWATGQNVVKVTASKAGSSSTTYTVIVTKS